MKKLLILSFLILPCLALSQSIKIDHSEDSYFFSGTQRLKSDLGDGFYEVYYDTRKTNLHYSGELKDGKKEGIWKLYNESGEIQFQVTYTSGAPGGEFTEYYSNGNKKCMGSMKGVFPVGIMIEWWENGVKKSEGSFLDGAKTGIWKNWDENGTSIKEVTFVKGREVDPK